MRIYTDSRCLGHQCPPGFPEVPQRVESILAQLEADGLDIHEGGEKREEEARAAVLAIHEEAYVERFQHAVERGDGLLDSADNPLSPKTWESAWAAVECGVRATDWVIAAPGRRAFAAVRPPGHHAERARAMGFCYFNNVAAMAQHLTDRHGLERVAVLDFDVHHGNGTQNIFWERSDVLYVSLHQFPFYPGTGAAKERGEGPGEGATYNVPLPAGTDDAGYQRAFEEEVLPCLGRFAPQLLLVSAGFDAWSADPLGGMKVSLEGFRNWGRWLRELVEEACEGRIVSILEGGYDLATLPRLAASYLAGLESKD